MDKKVKILLIEDNPGDVRLIQEMLKDATSQEFECAAEGSLTSGLRHLGEDKFDLVLLDLGLPETRGLDTLAWVVEKAKSVPIVVLTGLADEALGSNAVSAGAQDYLVKGQVDSNILSRSIRYSIRRKKTQERLRILNECLLSFSTDSTDNINRLVSVCGQLLGSACALYNRLDNNLLCSLGQWNVPPDYNPVDAPEGHICHDVITSNIKEVLVVRNLPETVYARTDPNVSRYKLQTYMGIPVEFGSGTVGSLCVVYQEDFLPIQEDKHLLGIIASAIAVEEQRRGAVEALLASERRYRRLHETMRDAFVSVNMDGRITDFNSAYRDMLGYSEQELRNLTYVDITPEKWHQAEAKIVKGQVLTRGYSDIYEKEYRRKDGLVFPVELRTILIRDEKGKPLSMWALVRDITDRKHAEETLRLQGAITSMAAEGINLVRAADGTIIYTNKYFDDMFGYAHGELTGMHISELNAPAEKTPLEMMQEIMTNMNKKGGWQGEVLNIRKDGTRFWSHASISQFEHKELGRLFITHQFDITEQKQAEEERQSQLQMINLASDAIMIRDYFTDTITYWNRGAENMYGWTFKEARGQHVHTFLHTRFPIPLDGIEEEFLRTSSWKGELVHICHDGTEKTVLSRWSLQRDASGKPVGLIEINTDITERKAAEQQIQEALEYNKKIFDSSPIAILTYDASGQCVSANEGAARAAGATVDAVMRQNYHDLASWKKSGMAAVADAVMDSGDEQTLETYHVSTFGRKAWYFCRFVRFLLRGERHLLLMIADTTERRKAEEENRLLASIVRNVPEAVCSIDLDGRIVTWNEGAESMLGYGKEEIMEKPITITIPEWLAQKELDHCIGILNAEGSFSGYESIRLAKDGRTIPVEITAMALKDDSGHISGYTSIMRDITERKETEKALLELFSEKEKEAETSKALLSMVETINSSLDEREIIKNLTAVAPKYLKFDRGSIFLYDDATEGFTYAGGYGLTPTEQGILLSHVFRKGDFSAVDMSMEGRTVVIENARESGLIRKELVDSLSIASIAVVPLSFRGRVRGVVIGEYRTPRTIGQKDLALLKGLADGTAAALQNSRLYRESVERAMELSAKMETIRTMSELDKEILSRIDRISILKTATVLITRVIPADRTAVLLKRESDYSVESEWGIGEFQGRTYPLADSHFVSMDRGRESVYIPDIYVDECPYHKEQAQLGIKSALLVPIVTKNGVIGLIDIGSTHPGRLTPDHLKTAESIASQIAVALENAHLYEELEGLLIGTITSLASAIDAKSPWTKGHSERVTLYAVEIGREMGLSGGELEELRLAGLLHDVGKIGTYDVLLDKPGKFTDAEMEIVKQHPTKGADILAPIRQLKDIIPGILYHHERMDGRGYPKGLRGEEIPLNARILCAADSFDAMTADRPYRKSPGIEYAISELKRCSGTQFDPEVAEAFLKVLAKPRSEAEKSHN